MQNIEYLAEEVRQKNYYKIQREKELQFYEVIAESKISAIKLEHFANSKGIFNYPTIKLMFISFKVLQWLSIVVFILYSPVFLSYLTELNFSDLVKVKWPTAQPPAW